MLLQRIRLPAWGYARVIATRTGISTNAFDPGTRQSCRSALDFPPDYRSLLKIKNDCDSLDIAKVSKSPTFGKVSGSRSPARPHNSVLIYFNHAGSYVTERNPVSTTLLVLPHCSPNWTLLSSVGVVLTATNLDCKSQHQFCPALHGGWAQLPGAAA